MACNASFAARPYAVDAVPGSHAVILPAQTADCLELEWQGAVFLAKHTLDMFNASGWRIIKREQLPENNLHFIWSQELLYACIPYQPLGQPIIDFLLCVLYHGAFLLPLCTALSITLKGTHSKHYFFETPITIVHYNSITVVR